LWQIYDSNVENVQELKQLVPLDSVLFNVGGTFGIMVWMLILLIWIDLITRMEQITANYTQQFHFARKVLIVALVMFFPVMLAINLINEYGIASSTMSLLYNLYALLYMICIIGWSGFHVIKMHLIIFPIRKSMHVIFRKNILLGCVDIIFFIYAITLVIYVATGAKNDPWKYLTNLTMQRVEEVILGITMVFCMESAILAGPEKLKATWQTGSTKSLQKLTPESDSRQPTTKASEYLVEEGNSTQIKPNESKDTLLSD